MQDNTDKNVYILGAGFSKELGLPLQDEFLLSAKEVFFRNTGRYEHFEKVFKYQDDLTKMRKFLNYPLLNLEHLFNLVEMDLFYSNRSETSEIKKDFVRLINDTLEALTPGPFDLSATGDRSITSKYNNYLQFLKMFIRKDPKNRHGIVPFKDTIISFNYDLVLEITVWIYNLKKEREIANEIFSREANYYVNLNCSFGKQNISIGDIKHFVTKKSGGSSVPSGDIFRDAESSIKLIKLHGSINWTSADGNTFIVPPTWNKSDPEIRKLWDIAYNELKDAKRIIIIGYSFPETDIYVKSLLALAMNENRILQNIYFINPDRNKVREACLSLLDKHFEKYCEYKEWTFSDFICTKDGREFIEEKLKRSFN